MNADTKKILEDTQHVVDEINVLLYTAHSIYKQGECWCVLDGKGGCINGHWSEDTLLRMYDQTVGYLQAIRTFYTAEEATQ